MQPNNPNTPVSLVLYPKRLPNHVHPRRLYLPPWPPSVVWSSLSTRALSALSIRPCLFTPEFFAKNTRSGIISARSSAQEGRSPVPSLIMLNPYKQNHYESHVDVVLSLQRAACFFSAGGNGHCVGLPASAPSCTADRDERRGAPLLLPLEHGLRGLDPEEHLLSETGVLVAGLHHVAGTWEKHFCKYMRSGKVVHCPSSFHSGHSS